MNVFQIENEWMNERMINSRKISAQIEKRFIFTKHFTATQLFQNENKYTIYHNLFPITVLDTTVECYPFFNEDCLRIELEVLYSRDNFCNLFGVIVTINYVINYEMEETFKKVSQLLKLDDHSNGIFRN